MEKTTSQKLRLALFVIKKLTLFVPIAHFIGAKQKMFEKTNHPKVFFNNASDLKLGDNVRCSRIIVNTLRCIEMINNSTISVSVFLDKTIFSHL
jgi:phospholipid/cholesterol/gamma-HCH transport system substrate-binding protein